MVITFWLYTFLLYLTPSRPCLIIENIKEAKGVMYIAVYDDVDKFPEDEAWSFRLTQPVNDNKLYIFLDDWKSDKDYAIAVYQDINSNGEMDKKMFGIPNEPFGFSNNVKPKFSAPKFDDCKVTLAANDSTIIKLIHKILF